MDTNKIEKFLLDRELEVISKKLAEIGSQIINIFSKYGKIEGDHSRELHDYIVKHVTSAKAVYYAGFTTRPQTNTHPSDIPESIKKIVLDWAVKDFFENIDQVSEIISHIEQ